MQKFKITFGDGSVLDGLSLNGNNFICNKKLTAEKNFTREKLQNVTIEAVESETKTAPEHEEFTEILLGAHEHMKLIQLQKYGSEYWFILADLSPEELKELSFDARLSYLEMMQEVL